MKNSTIVLLFIVAIVGGLVYYFINKQSTAAANNVTKVTTSNTGLSSLLDTGITGALMGLLTGANAAGGAPKNQPNWADSDVLNSLNS